MAENARAKGMRYLTEGRLFVLRVDGGLVQASCRGDSGEFYRLGRDRGGWHCDCPARTRCAHLHALMSVTVARRPETR